ncbi:Detected protein of unknown function [Hibiscus syriacus]|uniref:RRM domain-containing protein n=1 Tax=Hibiscus syriacus TaxID=106335 RepID=A0A6A2YSE5_HIBSY|nr:Detected protein of unknown function [Hibiscus syriacus]
MYLGGYTTEITSLSPKVTKKDLRDFFAYFGSIEDVEIIRCGKYACTAYVRFRDAYSLETAVLLNESSDFYLDGSDPFLSSECFFDLECDHNVLCASKCINMELTIIDQSVCISKRGSYDDNDSYPWDGFSWKIQDDTSSTVTHMNTFVSPGEAVTVVKTMLAKGINTSMETVKSVDEKYHVSGITKSVASVTGTAVVTSASFTGRTAAEATIVVISSNYFAKGALWISSMLNRAAQATADLGTHGNKQTPSFI